MTAVSGEREILLGGTLRHILITGAGGGLGSALAHELAGEGARLSLWGRNRERLLAVADHCRARGAEVCCVSTDIRDRHTTRSLLLEHDAEHPVDMAVLNAGVSSGVLPDGGMEPVDDVERTMDVNAHSTIAMAATLLSRMEERKQGHLVCISSLAALAPLPSSPAYCASKAAVAMYAKAMRLSLHRKGIRISIVYPGYVDTPMSRRLKGPQPWRHTAARAAAHICARLEKGADTIVFPKLLALGSMSLNFMPTAMAGFFARFFAFSVEPDAESPCFPTGENNRG